MDDHKLIDDKERKGTGLWKFRIMTKRQSTATDV